MHHHRHTYMEPAHICRQYAGLDMLFMPGRNACMRDTRELVIHFDGSGGIAIQYDMFNVQQQQGKSEHMGQRTVWLAATLNHLQAETGAHRLPSFLASRPAVPQQQAQAAGRCSGSLKAAGTLPSRLPVLVTRPLALSARLCQEQTQPNQQPLLLPLLAGGLSCCRCRHCK